MDRHRVVGHALLEDVIRIVGTIPRRGIHDALEHGIQFAGQQARSDVVAQWRTAVVDVYHLTRLTTGRALRLHVSWILLAF